MMTVHPKAIKTILLSLFWLAAALLPCGAARAQSGENAWGQAVNLSSAPAATAPVIVAGPEGLAQVFWWDEGEGLTTAIYDGNQWLAPEPASILLSPPSEEQVNPIPVAEMPTIVEDSLGWVHALWLGEEDAETAHRPLMHSRLALGSTVWDIPNQVTDSASVWEMTSTTGGALYLVYFRPAETTYRPAGLYHQRSFDGGMNWTDPIALSTSPDFSTTLQSTSFLDVAVSAQGSVYVTWDDPQSNRAMYTLSADGGRSWREPQLVNSSRLNARHARIAFGSEKEILLLWEATRSELAVGLYQQFSQDGGQTWRNPEQVMQDRVTSVQGIDLIPLADGRILMTIGGQAGILGLSVWDEAQAVQPANGWSDIQAIELRADDQTVGAVGVSGWHAALRGNIVTVVGRAPDNKIWALRIPIDQVEATYVPVPTMPQPTATPLRPQSDWGEPVNLSHSGSASQPALITGEGGTRQVFWWDQFDGLMSAHYDSQSWSPAMASPILIPEIVERVLGQPEIVRTPLAQMPQIVGDQGGRAHAFWLMRPQSALEEEEQQQQPTLYALMHSMLALGGTAWSEPQPVAESVLTWRTFSDPTGRLHLLYVRPTHIAQAPAGVYYTSLTQDAADWSISKVLYPSIYMRLHTAEQMHLTGAADADGNVIVAWNDPRLEAAFMARSEDAGASWEQPAQVSLPDVTLPQLAAVGESGFLVLWQAARTGYAAALYEQHSQDGGITWTTPRRVLENLNTNTDDITFQVSSDGSLILIAGMGSPSLTLAVWDDSTGDGSDPEWSEPQVLDMTVRDSETQETIWLDALQIAVSEEQFVLTGQGQDGELWVLQRENVGFDWFFAPPPPWSELARISLGPGNSSLPTMATDMERQVHVLWGESSGEGLSPTALTYTRWDGTRWTQPAQVLRSPDGAAEYPCLVAAGEYLHTVWSGGQNGQIYYSRAFVRDGGTPTGWSTPLALPGTAQAPGVGSAPHLVTDLGGNLHLVYAVPFNEGRGIYYLRSDDGGESWSAPQRIFDASAAGWASANRPALAVDVDGTVYIAWVRAPLTGTVAQGIYFARSTDGGKIWSEAFPIAEGDADQPQIAIAREGKVHVLWREVAGSDRWFHRWSVDQGRNWAPATQVRGFTNLQGQPSLAYDRVGSLYLMGIALDEVGEPELLFTTWDNESHQWVNFEYLRVGHTLSGSADVVSALLAPRGQLHIVLQGVVPDGESDEQTILLHSQRTVTAVEQMPMLLVTPGPTPTLTPVPGQTPTLRPTPTVNPAPPSSIQEVGFGPLSLPLLGVGGVLAIVMLLGGLLLLRSLRKQGGRYYKRRN